jgi:hypothetical protein
MPLKSQGGSPTNQGKKYKKSYKAQSKEENNIFKNRAIKYF